MLELVYNVLIISDRSVYAMKKIFSIIISVAMVAVMAVPAFAASGINAAEKQIIDKVAGGSNKYVALTQYQATMKNYFNQEGVDVTQAQADEINGYIQQIYDIADDYVPVGQSYDLNNLPKSVKKIVLQAGIDACAVIGLTLVWDSATTKVIITDAQGNVIFEALPIVEKVTKGGNKGSQIKVTGSADMTVLYVGLGILAVVVAGCAVFVIKKKA